MYDSTDDIQSHIRNVWGFIEEIRGDLMNRQFVHDHSKLQEPEKPLYDEFTPLLQGLTYGSDEYKAALTAMGPAIQHHYQANRHHPEHFENGINGMTLVDLVEMLADWKAAGMRHSNGSMAQSMEVNRNRFNISDQLYEILQNTVKELGW
jgi:hypothetical protein